jgi:hypothetical protein
MSNPNHVMVDTDDVGDNQSVAVSADTNDVDTAQYVWNNFGTDIQDDVEQVS